MDRSARTIKSFFAGKMSSSNKVDLCIDDVFDLIRLSELEKKLLSTSFCIRDIKSLAKKEKRIWKEKLRGLSFHSNVKLITLLKYGTALQIKHKTCEEPWNHFDLDEFRSFYMAVLRRRNKKGDYEIKLHLAK